MRELPREIEAFRQALLGLHPSAEIVAEAPEEADGTWWIDVVAGGETTLSWRGSSGFGIYADDAGFGAKPVFDTGDPEAAATAIMEQATRVRGHLQSAH
jgi:hypothetical protein